MMVLRFVTLELTLKYAPGSPLMQHDASFDRKQLVFQRCSDFGERFSDNLIVLKFIYRLILPVKFSPCD